MPARIKVPISTFLLVVLPTHAFMMGFCGYYFMFRANNEQNMARAAKKKKRQISTCSDRGCVATTPKQRPREPNVTHPVDAE